MKSTLAYSSIYINRNYLIKVNGISPSGDKLNLLVGVSGAIALIGEELFYKFIGRAERDLNHDVTHCKLRRGIKFFILSQVINLKTNNKWQSVSSSSKSRTIK